MADQKGDFSTTIGADAVFTGKLEVEKGVRLLGKFDGEIKSDGPLLVADGATLTGDVQAGSVQVEGQIKGNLAAKSKIQLEASARLEGDVQAAKLEVAEGAMLIGRCVIGANGQSKSQAAATKPASVPSSTVVPSKPKVAAPATGAPAAIRR